MNKQKIIITATELPDTWFHVKVSFEDGSEYGQHFSSSLQYARMDGMRIANQFLNGVLEPSSYEIVDHTYLSVIDKLVQFVTGVELTRPKAIGGHLGGLVAHILPFRLVISFSVPSRNSLGNVHALFDGLEGPMNDGWSCNYEFKACVTRELQQLFSESICAFHPRYIDILKDLNK